MAVMNFVCKHDNICRDCNDCYDDARAESEVYEGGIFVPDDLICERHPVVPLTEHYDCIICCYASGDDADD